MRDNIIFLRIIQYSMMFIFFTMIFLTLFFSWQMVVNFYISSVIVNIIIQIYFKSKLSFPIIIISSLMGPLFTVIHIYFYIKLKSLVKN
jgi:hypothetical protein